MRQRTERIPSRAVERSRAQQIFEQAWRDPSRPPWEIGTHEVELAKVRLLQPYVRGQSSVLDAGCGGGDFLDLLIRETGATFDFVAGMDIAEGALIRARGTGRYQELVCGQLDEAAAKFGRQFDLLLLSDVLYYVKDYELALEALARVVTTGGLILVSIAMGRAYFGPHEADRIRAALSRAGFAPLIEKRVDYKVARVVPRELVPFHRILWPQTHKLLWLQRRQ